MKLKFYLITSIKEAAPVVRFYCFEIVIFNICFLLNIIDFFLSKISLLYCHIFLQEIKVLNVWKNHWKNIDLENYGHIECISLITLYLYQSNKKI